MSRAHSALSAVVWLRNMAIADICDTYKLILGSVGCGAVREISQMRRHQRFLRAK